MNTTRHLSLVTCHFLLVTLISCTNHMQRTIIVPDAPAAIGPYSHAALCSGTMLYTSGQIGLLADGTMVPGGVKEQTQRALENVKNILASQGATMSDVVKTTVFLKSMNDFQVMNAEYAAAFGDHKPARSAVEVARLPKDALVEIEVIACLP